MEQDTEALAKLKTEVTALQKKLRELEAHGKELEKEVEQQNAAAMVNVLLEDIAKAFTMPLGEGGPKAEDLMEELNACIEYLDEQYSIKQTI